MLLTTGYNVDTIQGRYIRQNEPVGKMDAMLNQKPYNVEGTVRMVREVLDKSK